MTSSTLWPVAPHPEKSIHRGAPSRPTAPIVGLRPTSPHSDAGMRTEPPPSDDVAMGTSPAASAAAEPPLEPPGVRSRFHGLCVAPKTGLNVAAVHPYDGVFALPMGMAPAARSRATVVSSTVSGGPPALSGDP